MSKTIHLTLDQVAERWQVHKDTVLTIVHKGRLTAINVGTDRRPNYRVRLRDLERYETAREAKALGLAS